MKRMQGELQGEGLLDRFVARPRVEDGRVAIYAHGGRKVAKSLVEADVADAGRSLRSRRQILLIKGARRAPQHVPAIVQTIPANVIAFLASSATKNEAVQVSRATTDVKEAGPSSPWNRPPLTERQNSVKVSQVNLCLERRLTTAIKNDSNMVSTADEAIRTSEIHR
jgi:hypothetical protein